MASFAPTATATKVSNKLALVVALALSLSLSFSLSLSPHFSHPTTFKKWTATTIKATTTCPYFSSLQLNAPPNVPFQPPPPLALTKQPRPFHLCSRMHSQTPSCSINNVGGGGASAILQGLAYLGGPLKFGNSSSSNSVAANSTGGGSLHQGYRDTGSRHMPPSKLLGAWLYRHLSKT